ncbi:MAG: tetratricopeptide repeat protein [Spirochaetales bacterium]|nr:tetratricopeptide repeat protein [Spirochaetales bacterium]
MFSLFRKKPKPNEFDLVSEKWKTQFGFFDQKRFLAEQGSRYSAEYDKGRFVLKINKKSLFAWSLDSLYRYDQLMFEADIAFCPENGYSAMGFVFKYSNDENFYYFLISNKGFFRFDVVFNGNPMPRIGWTESIQITPEKNSLRVICRDTHFSFYINDEWVAEIEDDVLTSGQIGFAAQNFDEKDSAVFYLESFFLESRFIEVEKHFERWNQVIPQNPENRVVLAHSFADSGQLNNAVIQMRRALRNKKPEVEDYFFMAELLVNLGIYDLALKNVEKCLELEPQNKQAMMEKVNLLYLQNATLEARDYLLKIQEHTAENSTAWNLLGNCEYALGNWKKSIIAYKKAIEIQKDVPLFYTNVARSFEMISKPEEALKAYLRAAKIFFNQENYNDLYPVFARVQKIDPENKDVQALEAKILFHENRMDKANEVFEKLIQSGYEEGAVYFLSALIKVSEGNREKAAELFQKAVGIEPDYYLYWLKAAENLYLFNKSGQMELLKAKDLAPQDVWVLNLEGKMAMDNADFSKAEDCFSKALASDPGNVDVLVNYSQALGLQDKKEEALQVLNHDDLAQNPLVINQRGNLLTLWKSYDSAILEYDKALRIDGNNLDIKENCARTCLKLDMIMRAEELLTEIYDLRPSASVCNLFGYLALIKREWVRAEVAFKEALSFEPENPETKINLASYYIDRGKYDEARSYLDEVLAVKPDHEEALYIKKRIRDFTEQQYHCSLCDVAWWVRKDVPPQGAIRIHGEPPASAPAGECPSCGKVYCIGCAQNYLKDQRFVCPDCDEFLKLSNDHLKFLLKRELEKEAP